MSFSYAGLTTLLAVLAGPLGAQTGFPFENETLRYTINWQSGRSLGEAVYTAKRTAAGWTFTADIDGAVPGFPVKDHYRSSATAELCALDLDRDVIHGSRKAHEQSVFDAERKRGKRGSGPEFEIPVCPRDALTLLYFTRREMGQGRVPGSQTAYLGPPYAIRMEYTGAATITIGEKAAVTDRLLVSGTGPSSSFSFEMYFARDAARTPLMIRVPLALGTFSMELVR